MACTLSAWKSWLMFRNTRLPPCCGWGGASSCALPGCCESGELLSVLGIVIGIGILRAGRVVEIICLTLYIATELRPLAGPLRLKLE